MQGLGQGMGVVLQPWVAESKGRQNEYFECKKKDFLCSTDFKLLSPIKGN
jgi:hypothetical protein